MSGAAGVARSPYAHAPSVGWAALASAPRGLSPQERPSGLGIDLASVRVHTGPGADAATRPLAATAYTHPTLAFQASLEVGAANDPLEHEADRVAERVMRMPAPSSAPGRCACGGPLGPAGECSACKAQGVARLAIAPSAPARRDAPDSVHATLGRPGRPLDGATRGFFEPRLGADLRDVRIHDDPAAAASARDVAARAYTVGRDVVFGAGMYQPSSDSGRALLAHELAHVIQQKPSRPAKSTAVSAGHRTLRRAPGREPPPGKVNRTAPPSGGENDTPPPAGAAGGCGLCYQYQHPKAVGPREAGIRVHEVIQAAMQLRYDWIYAESWVRGRRKKGILDLARIVPADPKDPDRRSFLEIGEIKPADSDDRGILDLEFYLRIIAQNPRLKHLRLRPLELPCPQPLPFPTLSPNCPEQQLYVANTKGLYLYLCTPSFSQLMSAGCNCGEEERRKKKQPEQRVQPAVKPHRNRVREVRAHPYFEDYAHRLPDMEGPAGREYIVVIDDTIYKETVKEAERLRLEKTRRLMRPIDPHTSPIVQGGAWLVALAPYLGVALIVCVVVGAVPVIVALLPVAAELGAAAVAADAAATTTVVAADAAATTTVVTVDAAATTTGIASTIEAPAAIAQQVAAGAAGAAPAVVPATALTGGSAAWATGTLGPRAAALVVGTLIAGGVSESDAATAVKAVAGRRILAVADVTGAPDLINAKPGQDITVGGQTFHAIIWLTSRDF